jgi:CRP-like cAMP-binding protein
VPLTQEDLASLAGTSRATVNRVLGEAQAAGILNVGRGRIDITDPGTLEKRAR